MPVACYRLKGLQLEETAGEALKIGQSTQPAVEAGGGYLQRVLRAGDQVFDVEEGSEIAAEEGAVIVRDS